LVFGTLGKEKFKGFSVINVKLSAPGIRGEHG